jgi:hypothetical protein
VAQLKMLKPASGGPMRFIPLSLLGALLTAPAEAQESWKQLTGAAESYAVDLRSLDFHVDILSARIRTHDVGSRLIVQRVQVRCTLNQLRTIGEEFYDAETGRPVPQGHAGRPENSAIWPEYQAGSEGHALLSSLCELARERRLIAPGEHSLRAS